MSVTTQQRPVDERIVLRNQLTKMASEFRMALPSHIPPEKFARVVLTAVQQNPDLMYADRRTLLMAATKCAQDGLLPDGREAAFVIFNTKVKGPDGKEEWVKACQYLPMVAGVLKRVRNGGVVSSLEAHVVYANDHFVWTQGTESSLEHKPLFPGDRGEMIGAYAVARFKDGSPPVFRVMDKARIEKARAVSRTKNGPLWTQWTDEAWQKTVIRNLAKYLPADAEIETVAARDDVEPSIQDSTTTIDAVLTDEQRVAPPSRLDVIEGGLITGPMDGEDVPSGPDE
jgi:recombination protein RecT